MQNSFLFEYIDINNKAQKIKSKKNCHFEIKKFFILISVLNKKNEDISKRFTSYVYDISLYEEYSNLVASLLTQIKTDNSASNSSLTSLLQVDQSSSSSQCVSVLKSSINFLLKTRNKVFIRHGLEIFDKKQYGTKGIKFPLQSASCWNDGVLYVNRSDNKTGQWSKEKKDLKKNKIAYPIEVDMQPFCINLNSYKCRKWPKDPQSGYCSNHDSLYSWNKLKGYITYDDFTEGQGSIINSKRRDHLYASSEIPLDKWTFVYQNIEECQEKSKYWGWTQKKFTTAQFKHSIHLLLKNGIRVIPQELIYELYKLRKNDVYY